MSTRRFFIKATSFAMAGTGLYPLMSKGSSSAAKRDSVSKSYLQTGIAGFTFLNFSVEQSIAMMQRLQVDALSLKDFHLPLDSSSDKIAEVSGKFQAAGILVYAVGVIYMKSEADVDRAFEYAKKLDVKLIVCAPNYELLPYVEQKVKKYDIKIAVHNHGPEDKLYPSAKDAYDRISNMDRRVGLCLDIGHATRAGANLTNTVIAYAPRLFDMHIKDVSAAAQDAVAMEIGRGIIDFPALIKALRKIQYKGRCSIEFEKDMKDPLPGIAESIGFFRGVMDSIR